MALRSRLLALPPTSPSPKQPEWTCRRTSQAQSVLVARRKAKASGCSGGLLPNSTSSFPSSSSPSRARCGLDK